MRPMGIYSVAVHRFIIVNKPGHSFANLVRTCMFLNLRISINNYCPWVEGDVHVSVPH